MWVFCGGMFRSGSTVQYQIASHIVERLGMGQRVGRFAPEDFDQAQRAHRHHEGLLVFKSHGVSRAIREELDANGGHVITVHRDIRDVAASAMRKNAWSFQHIWKKGLLDRWTRRFEEWATLPGALVSRYDSMTSALEGEAIRIGRHLGAEIGPDLAHDIGREYSLDRQRERTSDVAARIKRHELSTKYDDVSQLHHNHIASGEVGIYREMLRPEEIRAVEDACGPWMLRWGYALESPALSLIGRVRRAWLGRAREAAPATRALPAIQSGVPASTP
jgi:hypothetical protein